MIYVMSGSGKAFAVIGVNYPVGSVCTCTDGTKTLNLKDTSGQGFFLIPYAATWTVTVTDGEREKSESVEITSEGQSVNVRLRYEVYLYEYGDLCTDLTGGWRKMYSGNATENDITFNSDNVKIGPVGNDTRMGGIVTINAIDLTEFNKFIVDCSTQRSTAYPNSNEQPRIGITDWDIGTSTSAESLHSKFNGYVDIPVVTDRSNKELDISNFTGFYRVGITVRTPYVTAYRIFLE